MAYPALEGIVAAPFLPMLPDFSIDWSSLRSYVAWIAEKRPTAIAMNMDASEGPSLSRDEQLEVVRVCREVIAGACPLFSGLIAGYTADAVAWGNEVKAAGAQGLAVFPPFPVFLGNPVPTEMIYAYHKAIADGVGLPLVAFQFPKAFGPDYPPDALNRLAQIPEVVGLKEASFDTPKTVETAGRPATADRHPHRQRHLHHGGDGDGLRWRPDRLRGHRYRPAHHHASRRDSRGIPPGQGDLAAARAARPVLLAAADSRLPAAHEGGAGAAGPDPARGRAAATASGERCGAHRARTPRHAGRSR
jgi:hypothetical protein